MKRYVTASTDNNIFHITMYLHPIFYESSRIFSYDLGVSAAVTFNRKDGRYHTDVNPSRIINGPLSEYKQELEPPIKEEWETFVEDCKWLVEEVGFTIIKSEQSIDSKKSEYVLIFGIDDTPCGTLVYDLRISDHPFDVTFPEEYKDLALEYLQIKNILNGEATKAGIDFSVEKVIVGKVKNDTWDRALERLFILLKTLKRNIRHRLNVRR